MESVILHLALFLIGFFGTKLIIPLFKNMLVNSNIVRPNYKGDMIPVCMGIVFLPMLIINAVLLILLREVNMVYLLLFVLGSISMFFIGSLDDIIGNRNVSGLKGHFKSLFKGELTTGGFKALFGGFIGVLIASAISYKITDVVIGTLIIALSTNLMNLLDLRPGRAIKGYLAIMVSLLLILKNENVKTLSLLILPNVLAYFNLDLKAKSMMGDTGSNVLGISIGILIVMGCSLKVRVGWLIFLILMHLLTEKYSLTKIIENNKVLNYIDNLGR